VKRFLIAALLFLASFSSLQADNWPQWRGPANDGICKETGLPTEWSDTKNVAWKLSMPGMAGSTPIVWDKRIFLTSEDGNDVVLLCASTDGKQLWKRKLGSGRSRYMKDEGNLASASPSTDGKLVFAFIGSGDLGCFDFDGNTVWKLNAQERYGKFNTFHGMHTSPVLDGDRLYLALMFTGGQWVICLDKTSGKEVWKVERKSDGIVENQHSYASPCIWRMGEKAYLVVHGNDYTTAHRLDDGSEIWRLADLNPKEKYNKYLRFVASPVAVPELIVVPTAKQGPVVCVKPDATGLIKATSEHEQWRRSKGTPDVPSPLVHEGLVYLCDEHGVLTCLDAKTGKERYKHTLHRDRYRASPVFADSKIYLTARDGTITVIKAGSIFEELAVNKMPDQITASPVIANGRVYIRGWETLYAIGN
jgi:outer membrane protein assembly factor BamB